MKEKLNSIITQARIDISSANDLTVLIDVRNRYLAKKSELMSIFGQLKGIPNEEKAQIGALINQIRTEIEQSLNSKTVILEEKEMKLRLSRERIDITLPGSNELEGNRNPYFVIQDEITEIFLHLGYKVAEGPEIESDHYNFELLNIPKDHPARDMQDSFYIDPNTLLRTHTSPVQARVMQESHGAPIRIICPGKVYRRDDDDNTHSHQFAQVEGLVIDKDINLGHLKATLELFAKAMFGEKREIRLRSSYFPFTEPSVEVDVSCMECGGKGCSICKRTGWIEILGAGMVHPRVLEMSGYDSKVYSGFAFGIGIERVAMLRYGIDDIRRFYQNDIRFIKQFNKSRG